MARPRKSGIIRSRSGFRKATVLALHPNTVSFFLGSIPSLVLPIDERAAEYRGPGIRNQFKEGADDFDVEVDRTRGFSVRSGRIILLGDGTEVLTEQNDDELFDHTEEDQDVSNQEPRESPDATRNDREGTPGPQLQNAASSHLDSSPVNLTESPASTTVEPSSAPASNASKKPSS